MRIRTLFALAATGALALAATAVAPASAACDPTTQGPCTAATTVEITLSGGTFSIATDAPTATGAGSVAPGSIIAVDMPTTTVTDNRGSLLGWNVTADLTTAPTHVAGETTYTIPGAAMTWVTGTVATTSGALAGVSAGLGGSLAAPVPVAVSVLGFGGGTYTYTPSVSVVVPPNLVAGTYTGTVTQSLA
ncbi:MAG TPA: hypothetical protein VF230_11500 [Acidimicrobiales bacterium]